MEEIDKDYKQQTLKNLAELFKLFDRVVAPLSSSLGGNRVQTVRSIGLISSRYGSLVAYPPGHGTRAHKRAGNRVCCGVNGHTLDSRLFLLCLPSPH